MKKELEYIKSKGFIIDDEARVIKYLNEVGIYKLSKYFIDFRGLKNIDFCEVINHYQFDLELRNLNLGILEVIENSFKNQFVLVVGEKYENLNFYNDKYSEQRVDFIKDKITYLREFDIDIKKLNGEKIPCEIFVDKLTFGEIFKIYRDLKYIYKYNISSFYNFKSARYFENWIFCLKYLRNLCSHGENIFNRQNTEIIKGKKISKYLGLKQNNIFASYFVILCIFSCIFSINKLYIKSFFLLLSKYKINFNLFLTKKETPPYLVHSLEAWEVLVQSLYDFYIKKSNKKNKETIKLTSNPPAKDWVNLLGDYNVLTLGLGAFGFAINKVLGENNPNTIFYGFELNTDIVDSIKKNREHPYFFKGYKLPENIKVVDNYEDLIGDVDLLILAMPAQFIAGTIEGLKGKLKSGVTILNLAKGIDIKSNKTISQLISDKLGNFEYNYAVLSGGMIASEVVEGKVLGTDIGIKDFYVGNSIKKLLENDNLKVKLRINVVNIELYGSLKNIAAILVGYYEGKGLEFSSIGYYLMEFYEEMKDIIELYGGSRELDFSYYSLGGDLVATCFGNSRNRYFGKLLGSGKNINEVLKILKSENKHAEGYETLKAVYSKVEYREGFEIVKFLYGLIN